MNTTRPPAIIVIRHGCDGGSSDLQKIKFDVDTTEVSFNGPDTEVKDNVVTVQDNWLGPDGLDRAIQFGKKLPDWINARYATVTTVISEGPGNGHDGTPNPVNTIAPYVQNTAAHTLSETGKKLKLCLLKDNAYDKNTAVLSPAALQKTGAGQYSTVICWEALGMWRSCSSKDKGKGKEDCNYNASLLLGSLSNDPNNPLLSKNSNSPAKGQTVYVYTNPTDDRYDLTVFNFDGQEFTKVTGHHLPRVACEK